MELLIQISIFMCLFSVTVLCGVLALEIVRDTFYNFKVFKQQKNLQEASKIKQQFKHKIDYEKIKVKHHQRV